MKIILFVAFLWNGHPTMKVYSEHSSYEECNIAIRVLAIEKPDTRAYWAWCNVSKRT